LPRLPFDHNPLILHTASPSPPNVPPFRFEKQWLGYENFTELLTGWWYSFALAGDLANQWRSKLQFIRKNVEVGIEISKLNNLRKKMNVFQQLINMKYYKKMICLLMRTLLIFKLAIPI
jgi:hypothetical protein